MTKVKNAILSGFPSADIVNLHNNVTTSVTQLQFRSERHSTMMLAEESGGVTGYGITIDVILS